MRAKVSDTTRKLVKASRDALELEVANKTLEAKNAELKAQLAKQKETTDRNWRHTAELQENYDQLMAIHTELHDILHEIGETIEIDSFNEESPGDFVRNVARVFSGAKSLSSNLAACTRELDRICVRYCKVSTMYLMFRQGVSGTEVETFAEDRSPELLKQYIDIIMLLRAKHEKQGVILPPPHVTVDDLYVPLKPQE